MKNGRIIRRSHKIVRRMRNERIFFNSRDIKFVFTK